MRTAWAAPGTWPPLARIERLTSFCDGLRTVEAHPKFNTGPPNSSHAAVLLAANARISHGAPKLRNRDQQTAADTKRVFMTRAKFVLVAWFEIPAEPMLFGWPKHEVRGNFSGD